MKSLIFLCSLLIICKLSAADEIDLDRLATPGRSHICYFSLNNEKEFQLMDELSKKLNKNSPHKITVSEYQTLNSNPEESFFKLIESGQKCDGLVISGHHTGAFGGKRAVGQLEIDFLEKLSCNKKYKKFFENIKALWLQGCRTLGEKIISSEINSEEVKIRSNSTQGNTLRLGDIAGDDSIEVDHETLERHYGAAMDQDNPLGTRFLRVFNRASVFAWSKTAPGEAAKSELSLLMHIAHISHVLDPDREEYFTDVVGTIEPTQAVRYASALIGALQRGSEEYQQFIDCMGLTEDQLLKAWKNHGTKNKVPGIRSYDNSDLDGLMSLPTSGNEDLQKARVLGCALRSNNNEVVKEALREVLKNKNLIGYTWNTILYHIKKIPNDDILKLIKESGSKFKDFITKKIYSDGTGALAKFEFLQIAKQLYPEEVVLTEEEKKHITSYAALVLNLEDKENWSLVDYKQALVQRILDYEPGLVEDLLINSSGLNAVGFNRLAAMALQNKKQFLPRAVIDTILKNPKSDADTFSKATTEMFRHLERHKQDPGSFLSWLLVQSANVDYFLMLKISAAIDKYHPANAEELFQNFINHGKTNNSLLRKICDVIGKSNLSKSDKEDLLYKISNRELVDDKTKLKVKESLQALK